MLREIVEKIITEKLSGLGKAAATAVRAYLKKYSSGGKLTKRMVMNMNSILVVQ